MFNRSASNGRRGTNLLVFLRLCLVACFFALPGGIAGQVPPNAVEKIVEPSIPSKDYAHSHREPFRGDGVKPAGWDFTSRYSGECVQFEPTGLRIAMPPGKVGGAGIVSSFGAKGDFEITLSFEVLKDPDPATEGIAGTRFFLAAALDTPMLDTPKSIVATLSRSMASKGLATWARTRERPAPFSDDFPTPTTAGRLRLVRSGDQLFYLTSTGSDQPFRFLKKVSFGTDDLKRVAIVGATGSDKALLEVRVTDFLIRADAILRAPAADLAAASPLAQPLTAPRKGWLLAALLVALALAFILGVCFYLRMRRGDRGENEAAAALVSWPCPGCGLASWACPGCSKQLKTTPDSAGKKVKCPHCGEAALVPNAKTEVA